MEPLRGERLEGHALGQDQIRADRPCQKRPCPAVAAEQAMPLLRVNRREQTADQREAVAMPQKPAFELRDHQDSFASEVRQLRRGRVRQRFPRRRRQHFVPILMGPRLHHLAVIAWRQDDQFRPLHRRGIRNPRRHRQLQLTQQGSAGRRRHDFIEHIAQRALQPLLRDKWPAIRFAKTLRQPPEKQSHRLLRRQSRPRVFAEWTKRERCPRVRLFGFGRHGAWRETSESLRAKKGLICADERSDGS